MSVYINAYDCITSSGVGKSAFWNGLLEGKMHRALDGVHRAPALEFLTSKERIVSRLLDCFKSTLLECSFNPDSLGVIYASTKGCIEDHLKEKNLSDSLSPVLTEFLIQSGLKPQKSICVSNACASSHAALFLAKHWLEKGYVKSVVVLAADEVGDFILKGFQSLRALSKTGARPFSANRDGLALGEAAACMILSLENSASPILESVALDTEGYAITRPSPSGESLLRAFRAIEAKPDLVIGHGTATKANDAAEDSAISTLFGEKSVPVTGTKWSIGHSLGASGMLDSIAACVAIDQNKYFGIQNLLTVDPQFKSHILARETTDSFPKLNSILVSSLGFGGTHAALWIRRGMG